jgi:hypothetical protein
VKARAPALFSTVTTEGAVLPADLLARIAEGDSGLDGLTPESYHLSGERIGEATSRAWTRLLSAWSAFQTSLAKSPGDVLVTGVTRERWLLPLFQELGYGRLSPSRGIEHAGKSHPVSHLWSQVPIHLVGARIDLDRRTAGAAGAAKMSPHGLVQDVLNKVPSFLWGFVSNGLQLRVLRDNVSLTRQAYVEFDLEAMMTGEVYSDFVLLWLLCHESRVEGDDPAQCWLERWSRAAAEQGTRALDQLRTGVEAAIEALGRGFMAHRGNSALVARLHSGQLSTQDYYRQLLRLVYRLIFLFAAEDRGLLLDPAATTAARDLYRDWYSTARLRHLAGRRRGTSHPDLFRSLVLIMFRLRIGCADLGLPALGGFLWSSAAAPDLTSSDVANRHLLEAIRSLSVTRDDGAIRIVDYRNLGAEELGSVYESLLELHPRLNAEAGTFELATAAGHERKTTGSYYTPKALVDCLLDAALEPLLNEAASAPDPSAAILELRVCDPACGSGHFLLAAARRMAKRLAAVRSGDVEPSPRDVQHALREVVGHCIYGVDINPMAVELCKVGLWMEALDPGKPMTFLEAHIRCGNALVGATPDLMKDGVPDEAWTALKGEDKAIARRLGRANKDWQQLKLPFDAVEAREDALVAEAMATLDAVDDTTSDALARKEAAWSAVQASPELRHAWLVADLWCASFVWPKVAGEAEDAAPVRGLWQQIKRSPAAAPSTTLRIAAELAERCGFFHWHLAFPSVMASGGFDLMLGNPPWETLSPDSREFFSQYHAGMRSLSPADQDVVVKDLMSDPATSRAWERHCLDLFGLVHFLKSSGRFTLFAPGNLGKGDFNVYRMFAELALKHARIAGFAAQVLPGGIYGGANASAIRKFMLDECELTHLFGFSNNTRSWFAEVDVSRFAAFTARRGGRTNRFLASFGLSAPADLARDPMDLDADVVRTQSPDTYAIPDVRTTSDVTVAAKMYARHPAFGNEGAPPPYRHYQAELHMGNDTDRFSTAAAGLPVYEGRMLAQYDHRAKTYESGHGNSSVWRERPFGDPSKAIIPQWRVEHSDVPTKLGDRTERFRIGFRDIAQPRDVRSLIAAIVPPAAICGDTVPTIVFDREWDWAYLPWLAVANSFTMDCLVRRKLSSPHLKFFIMDTLPFPRPKLDETWVRRVSPLVLRLTCTSSEMTDFWNAMARVGFCDPIPAGSVPSEALIEESARDLARAEIDAVVARDVYGLSRTEIGEILESFPVVKKRDLKAYGEFRTRRLILQAYDALDRAATPVATQPVTPPPR